MVKTRLVEWCSFNVMQDIAEWDDFCWKIKGLIKVICHQKAT